MLPREYPNLFIDGRWQEPDSSERLDVISPSTGETDRLRAVGLHHGHRSRRRGRAQGVLRDGLGDTSGRGARRDVRAPRGADRRAPGGVPRPDRRRARAHEVPRRGLPLRGADAALELLREARPQLQVRRGARGGPVAAGRQRGRADHEVRDQEPRRARAGGRRGRAVRVQLPAAGHRAEDGAGAGGRVHRRRQGARPGPAGDLRDGRLDQRGRLPARRGQHRGAPASRRPRTWSVTPTWTW